MTRRPSNYTLQEKLEGASIALAVGDEAAARQLGIPRRTISMWRNDPRIIAALPEQTLSPLAVSLNRVVNKAIACVEAKLDDPAARLGEMAQVLKVAHEGARLAAGEANRRVEARSESASLSINVQASAYMEQVAAILQGMSDESIRAVIAALQDQG